MTKQKKWRLWIRDKSNGKEAVYFERGTTAEIAFQIACAKDEYDAIPTHNYVLVRADELELHEGIKLTPFV